MGLAVPRHLCMHSQTVVNLLSGSADKAVDGHGGHHTGVDFLPRLRVERRRPAWYSLSLPDLFYHLSVAGRYHRLLCGPTCILVVATPDVGAPDHAVDVWAARGAEHGVARATMLARFPGPPS